MTTDLLFLSDAYLAGCDATVTRTVVDGAGRTGLVLDRTVFYFTSGGQPHDTGEISGSRVTEVRRTDDGVVHWLEAGAAVPAAGGAVTCVIDWDRRHRLMRTHTAMHVLCGVIWNEWKVPVTGGNMEPLSARMDFEFDPLPEGFAGRVEALVNDAIAADHAVEVSFLGRGEALADDDLIRTKVSLIPASVERIRVVDIVGLDRQADGGTHVASTAEVGRLRVTKVESKGRGNKRVRVEIDG